MLCGSRAINVFHAGTYVVQVISIVETCIIIKLQRLMLLLARKCRQHETFSGGQYCSNWTDSRQCYSGHKWVDGDVIFHLLLIIVI